MADGICAERRVLTYGTIFVVGGGCYGSYYVRQLRRGRTAGAIDWSRLVVVDRDPSCAVFVAGGDDVAPVVAEWQEYFGRYLDGAAGEPSTCERDAIVPSPLMPHLMFRWVLERARMRWPARMVAHIPSPGTIDVPWQRVGDDGTQYVSFATWMCPINCIEPTRCPHTRAPRDWSMPVTLHRSAPLLALQGTAVIAVTHRAYGVGMLDVRDVLAADAEVARAGAPPGRSRVLVGTASHCHGAAGLIEVS